MPHPNRILKTYVLSDSKKRGALWSLWLSPVEHGNNNIYFSNNGYLDPDKVPRGHSLHLSLHKDGRSHVRYEGGGKIHTFDRKREDIFPICSVFTPLSDLVEIKTPLAKLIDLQTVQVKEFDVSDDYNWSELAILHTSNEWIKDWNYSSSDYNFELIEEFDIKQDRKIVVLHRYIRKPTLRDFETVPAKNNVGSNIRITYWAVKDGENNYVIIYDFSSDRVKNGDFTSL